MNNQVKRPPTLLEVVADAIRSEIHQGSLQPGEALREEGLSESFKVSRITVREALRKLHEEGLVELIPHRGAFVKTLTPQLVKEIYTLRALLEPHAVRVALENGIYTAEDFQELERFVNLMGEHEQHGQYYEMIKADVDFHLLLCQRSGLSLINEILIGIQSMNLLFMLNTRLYQSDSAPEELSHRIVLDAIHAGDPVIAEAILKKHIENAGESLIHRMKEIDWQAINLPH
jgi:DNA-binding GntR family transcriptional regulator